MSFLCTSASILLLVLFTQTFISDAYRYKPHKPVKDKVSLNPPRHVSVIRSSTWVVVQWQEPEIHDQEILPHPDHIAYEAVGSFSSFIEKILPTRYHQYMSPYMKSAEKFMEEKKHTLKELIVGQIWNGVNDTHAVFAGNKTVVPHKEAVIRHYLVTLMNLNTKNLSSTEYMVPAEQTETRLTDLKPLTRYSLRVDVVYVNNIVIAADAVRFTTAGSDDYRTKLINNTCYCDEFGHDPMTRPCHVRSVPMCSCLSQYTGLFCELCVPKYYRVSPNLPCHPCPCNPQHSSGTCRVDTHGVRCLRCKVGYIGRHCRICDRGYYPHHGYCQMCECNNHHNRTTSQICTTDKGECVNCIHNTTGFHCDECLKGYEGNPIHGQCLLAEPSHGMRKGLVAAICIGVIILLSVIAGYFVYRRYKVPVRKQFWTVEISGNSDGVNINGLSDDGTIVKPLQDFSPKKSQRKRKDLAYSLLQEDI